MSSKSTNQESEENRNSRYSSMYSIFHVIIGFFAIFLSFKCNHGLNIGEFLLACCCPVLYILYKFAVSPNFCELTGVSVPIVAPV